MKTKNENAKAAKTVSLKPAKQAKAETKPQAAPAKPALSDAVKAKIREDAHEQIAALSRRNCACGCNTPTKSTFAPGHDARMFSRLVKEAEEAALAQLAREDMTKTVRAPKAAKRSSN